MPSANLSIVITARDEASRVVHNALSSALPASQALLAGVAGVGGAMLALGGASIKLAGDMEQSEMAFTTLLGSGEKAKAFLGELSDFAAKTPFELTGLQESSRRLLAFGFESQQIIPMMTNIGDAVSGLGGGAAEINRVTLALGQMQAKGKVSAEEMNQLAELGIPGWKMIADAIGVDIPRAMKMAEQGAISSTVAIPALLEGMNEKFGGMMAAQATTINGLFSNVKDNVTKLMISLGTEIVDALDLKPKIGAIVQGLTALTELVQAKGLAGALNEIFPPEVRPVIVAIAGAIAMALVPALGSIAAGFLAAAIPIIPFLAAGALVALLASQIVGDWSNVTDFFSNELGPRLESVGSIAQTAMSGDFAGAFNGAKDLLEADIIPSMTEGMDQMGERLVGWVAENGPIMLAKLNEFGNGILTWIGDEVPKLGTKIALWVPQFTNWVAVGAREILPKLGDFITGVMTWIKESGPGFLTTLIGEWVPNFIGWVASVIADIVPKLFEFYQAVAIWIKDVGGPGFAEMAVALGKGLLDGIVMGLGRLAELLSVPVTAAVNAVIEIINGFIARWNALHFDIPTVEVPGGGTLGGQTVGVQHIPPLTKLAQGGIVLKPTMAMIGEAGPEAVVPLNHTGSIGQPWDYQQLAQAMVQALADQPLVAHVSEREIMRASRNQRLLGAGA
jgi:tape measure domain-containing protein